MEKLVGCSIPWKVTFAASSEVYQQYCNRVPKCDRRTHELTVTQSELAETAAAKMATSPMLTTNLPDNYDEIVRIQDWLNVHIYNSSLTRAMFKINYAFVKMVTVTSAAVQGTQTIFDALPQQNISCLHDVQVSMTSVVDAFKDPDNYFTEFMYRWPPSKEDFIVRLCQDLLLRGDAFVNFLDELDVKKVQLATAVEEFHRCLINAISNNKNNPGGAKIYQDILNMSTQKVQPVAELVMLTVEQVRRQYQDLQDAVKMVKLVASSSRLRDIGGEFVKRNIMKFSVYFDDLTVMTVYQQYDDRLENLIADLGGSLGIALGGSVLTLMELCDVLVRLCKRRTKQTNTIDIHVKEANSND